MRIVALLVSAALLAGCNLVFKLPTRQGNVLDQKDIDKVQLGMTKEQVRFTLGTPLAANPMHPERWDYMAYYKNPRGKVFSRTVTYFFEGDVLARMEGEKAPANFEKLGDEPDTDQIAKEEKKTKAEEERANEKTDTGVIISPK